MNTEAIIKKIIAIEAISAQATRECTMLRKLLGDEKPAESVKDIVRPVLARRQRVKINRKERIIN